MEFRELGGALSRDDAAAELLPAYGAMLSGKRKGTLRARHFAGPAGSGSREAHADRAWTAIQRLEVSNSE
jgi:hypothetical protein